MGYIPLFYGKEYLKECIKSMEPFVDEIFVLYTRTPSQSHTTTAKNPETEDELQDCCLSASNKIRWRTYNTFKNENAHRKEAENIAKMFQYDLIITCDSDEVLEPSSVLQAIEFAKKSPLKYHGADGFVNFWRSFDFCFRDHFLPIRIVNMKGKSNSVANKIPLIIYHFSCAQKEEIVRFKWEVSGHKKELRPQWIDKIWLPWHETTTHTFFHPVSREIWKVPEKFNKETLPDFLKTHPNYEQKYIPSK